MIEQNKEFNELVMEIQKECHKLVDDAFEYFKKTGKHTDLENQDITNVFLFKKLADIELRLRELERRTTISDN